MGFSSLRSVIRRQRGYQPRVEQLERRELLSVAPDKFVAGTYKDLLQRPVRLR